MKFLNRKIFCVLLLLFAFLQISGCSTREALTAGATECRVINVKIIPSRYEREGSRTSWCARCLEKMFACVTNAEKSEVQCRRVEPGPPCQ
jgi:hypothetical protein